MVSLIGTIQVLAFQLATGKKADATNEAAHEKTPAGIGQDCHGRMVPVKHQIR